MEFAGFVLYCFFIAFFYQVFLRWNDKNRWFERDDAEITMCICAVIWPIGLPIVLGAHLGRKIRNW